MRSIRPIQLAAILIGVAVVTGVSISKSAPNDKDTQVYPMIYSVADLPVYRLVGDRPTFDPSAVIALIEQSVAPDSWGDDGGSIAVLPDRSKKLSLVVCQTQENHEQLIKRLESLRKTQQPSKPQPAKSQSPARSTP